MPEIEQDCTELTAEEVAELVSLCDDFVSADAPAVDASAFVPTDAAGVDWVLGKMNAARAEATLIRQNAELMARACERQAEALEWKYGAALQTWLRAELGEGKNGDLKRKSVRLYHGQLGLRTKPAGIHVTDPAAALGWAKEHLPAAVLEGLDKKALSARLLENGESVPFAELQAAEEVFYIK